MPIKVSNKFFGLKDSSKLRSYAPFRPVLRGSRPQINVKIIRFVVRIITMKLKYENTFRACKEY